jgi:secreted trypsin-like serine protease
VSGGPADLDDIDQLYLFTTQEPGEAHTCFGDSGGPVFLGDGADECLVGTVVGGNSGCSSGYFGRADLVLGWVGRLRRQAQGGASRR